MVEYSTVNIKLSNTETSTTSAQLKHLKDKTGTTLRMNLKMFNGNDLVHELLLTARQKTKLRNAFNNNMSTNIKLSKAQISKIIQSGGILGSFFINLADPLIKAAVPLAKNILPPLRITSAASAIDAGIQKKIHGTGLLHPQL